MQGNFEQNHLAMDGQNTLRHKYLSTFYALGMYIVILPFTVAASSPQFSLADPFIMRWQFEIENTPYKTLNLTLARSGEALYLPLSEGVLVSLQAADGKLLWKADTGGEFSTSPVADAQRVYVASVIGSSNKNLPQRTGVIRALSSQSGVTLWVRALPTPVRRSLTSSDTMLYGASDDGHVYALRKDTGDIVWSLFTEAPLTCSPVIHQNKLYIGNASGLFAIDQETGRTLWRYRTRRPITTSVTNSPEIICFGSDDNYVYALNTSGKLQWRARTGAAVQSVTFVPKGLVVASLDNFIYLLTLRRGERSWKRQLSGRVAAQPLVLNDMALFLPLGGDACVVLNLQDGKQANSISVGEGNTTTASPVITDQLLFITTRRGLVAFSNAMPNSEKTVSLLSDMKGDSLSYLARPKLLYPARFDF